MNIAKMQHSYLRRAKNHDILIACQGNYAVSNFWFGIVDTLYSACGLGPAGAVFFFAGIVLENSSTDPPFCQYIVRKIFLQPQYVVFLAKSFACCQLDQLHPCCLILDILVGLYRSSAPENLDIKLMLLQFFVQV